LTAELDELCACLAAALGVPTVLVSTFADGRQHFAGAHGIPGALATTRVTSDRNPLCERVAATGRPVIVHDARRRNAPGDRSIVALGIVAYAGLPLVDDDDRVIGVVAAIERRIHGWTAPDITTLRAFAAAIGALLARGSARRHVAELEARLAHQHADRVFLEQLARQLGAVAAPRVIDDAAAALELHLDDGPAASAGRCR